MVPIARFTNLAELGFFEELFSKNEVEMAVREVDEFNAVAGQWNRHFILSVVQEDSRRATELMKGHLGVDDRNAEAAEPSMDNTAHSGDYQRPLVDRAVDPDDTDLTLDPAKLWVPLVLMVLTGGLAYWALTLDPPGGGVPPGNVLWEALSESDEPLETLPRPGGFARRLQFDSQTGHFILEDDTDGDQRLDRRREYSREKLLPQRGR